MIKVFQGTTRNATKASLVTVTGTLRFAFTKKSDGVNAKKPKQIVIIKISLLGKKVSGANKKPLRLKKDPEKGK